MSDKKRGFHDRGNVYIEEEYRRYVICIPRLDMNAKLICTQKVFLSKFVADKLWLDELNRLVCNDVLETENDNEDEN